MKSMSATQRGMISLGSSPDRGQPSDGRGASSSHFTQPEPRLLILSSKLYFIFSLYNTVCRLTNVLVDGDRAYRVGIDVSARWVLDVLDVSTDIGLNVGVFENTVAGSIEGAVLEYQLVGIAQQLYASQMAVHQSDVLRVPSQVLTINQRVVDSHVLALPERVFGDDMGIVQTRISSRFSNHQY